MSTVEDVAVVLLRANVIRADQLEAAQAYQQKAGGTLEQWLVQFGYVTQAQAAWAVAQAHGLPYIDLTGVSVPEAVIGQLPESVARENEVFPLQFWPGGLLIAVAQPENPDLLQKLRFILNREIQIVVAAREQIVAAISRHYGGTSLQSVDSCLCEFTDTAIDFSEGQQSADSPQAPGDSAGLMDMLGRLRRTDCRMDESSGAPTDGRTRVYSEDFELSDSKGKDTDFDLAMESEIGEVDSLCEEELCAAGESDTMSGMPAARPAEAPSRANQTLGKAFSAPMNLAAGSLACAAAAPLVERHATVRYYCRMNPQRLFPLLVILSKKAIQQVVKKQVAQKQGEKFQVAIDSYVEIEPILAGCQVYPPKEVVKVTDGEVSARFWMVPNVLGEVMQARVLVRQDGQVLTEVPLEIKVVRQSAALLVGMMSFLLPFALLLMQHFGLDFDNQARQGYGLYAQGASWLMESLSPELLTGLLLGLTAGVWLWLRPRQRDVFWDIVPHEPSKQIYPDRQERNGRSKPLHNHQQAELFQQAERNLRWQRHAMALHLFEKGLSLGRAPIDIHADASQAASAMGRLDRALEILQQAESAWGPAAIKGPMWYRMAILAVRLGRDEEAMAYLKRAVEKGFADPERLEADPELASLRGRADYPWLLASRGA